MIRTLQINLTKNNEIINECIKAKELYNALNFLMRQQYFKLQNKATHPELTDEQLNIMSRIKFNVNYPFETNDVKYVKEYCDIQLHSKVTQSLINSLAKNWKSFFALKKKEIKCNIPHYKQKYYKLNFNKQTISMKELSNGYLKTYLFKVRVPKMINSETIQACELSINAHNVCILYIQYHQKNNQCDNHLKHHVAALDLGVQKLATIAFDTNYRPLTYDGKKLLSINQGCNKLIANYQTKKNKKMKSKIHTKRNRQIKHLFHRISNLIISDLLDREVKTLVIGKNKLWKNKVHLGKKNNQKFYQLPFNLLITMLRYKCEEVGIDVIEQEESYTSKASFLDNDEIPTYEKYNASYHNFSGKRTNRSTYQTKNNVLIHADVNGAYNILVKSNQSDHTKLNLVRNWLCRGCRVVQPIGRKVTFN